jgi:hypothetical protein
MKCDPIFIAGPDRSGTTLLFAMLASHPRISMVRRTNMWRYFYGRYGSLNQPDNFERCLDHMVRYNRMRHLQPDPERIRQAFWLGEPTYGRLFALFHEHNAERAGKPRWGDKSLHTEHYAHQVLAEFPRAKIIHMTRDPRDRYASVRKRHGKDSRRVGAANGRWLYSMRAAKRNLKQYPDNYMIVRYEALAACPVETLVEICAFIDEQFSPAMLTLAGERSYVDRGGNSSFDQIEPGVISTKPIGRFRQVLSTSEVAFIQKFAGGEMAALGYQLEPIHFSANERFVFYAKDAPLNLARMAGWLALTTLEIKKGAGVPASRLRNIVLP